MRSLCENMHRAVQTGMPKFFLKFIPHVFLVDHKFDWPHLHVLSAKRNNSNNRKKKFKKGDLYSHKLNKP